MDIQGVDGHIYRGRLETRLPNVQGAQVSILKYVYIIFLLSKSNLIKPKPFINSVSQYACQLPYLVPGTLQDKDFNRNNNERNWARIQTILMGV